MEGLWAETPEWRDGLSMKLWRENVQVEGTAASKMEVCLACWKQGGQCGWCKVSKGESGRAGGQRLDQLGHWGAFKDSILFWVRWKLLKGFKHGTTQFDLCFERITLTLCRKLTVWGKWKQGNQCGVFYNNLGWNCRAWTRWEWWRSKEVVRFMIYLESRVIRIYWWFRYGAWGKEGWRQVFWHEQLVGRWYMSLR